MTKTDQTPLPTRGGARPATTPTNPHTQLDQIAPVALQDRLRDHALSLPGVRPGVSQVSVPGTVVFFLHESTEPTSMPNMFGGEWGHIHPHYDGSLHLNVPTELAERLIAAGWAEYHSLAARGMIPPLVVMLYGPRDEAELAFCMSAVEEAYLANGGARRDATGRVLGFATN